MDDGMDFSQMTSHPNIIYVAAGTALVLVLTIGKPESHVPSNHRVLMRNTAVNQSIEQHGGVPRGLTCPRGLACPMYTHACESGLKVASCYLMSSGWTAPPLQVIFIIRKHTTLDRPFNN